MVPPFVRLNLLPRGGRGSEPRSCRDVPPPRCHGSGNCGSHCLLFITKIQTLRVSVFAPAMISVLLFLLRKCNFRKLREDIFFRFGEKMAFCLFFLPFYCRLKLLGKKLEVVCSLDFPSMYKRYGLSSSYMMLIVSAVLLSLLHRFHHKSKLVNTSHVDINISPCYHCWFGVFAADIFIFTIIFRGMSDNHRGGEIRRWLSPLHLP